MEALGLTDREKLLHKNLISLLGGETIYDGWTKAARKTMFVLNEMERLGYLGIRNQVWATESDEEEDDYYVEEEEDDEGEYTTTFVVGGLTRALPAVEDSHRPRMVQLRRAGFESSSEQVDDSDSDQDDDEGPRVSLAGEPRFFLDLITSARDEDYLERRRMLLESDEGEE